MSIQPTPSRKEIRRQLISLRETMPLDEYTRLSQSIGLHLESLIQKIAPACLSFYWPFRKEPDITTTIKNWLSRNPTRRAALPITQNSSSTLAFKTWQVDSPLMAGQYGIMIPRQGEICQPELIIIPVNGFDARGFRLGYGGGYFDRTLAQMPDSLTIGIGFESARLAHLAEEPHDICLNWVVTEQGIVYPKK